MTDYTQVFNQARQAAGLTPTKATVLAIEDGMPLRCGCKVHRFSLSHFTVYHDENCKRPNDTHDRRHKEVVGTPGDGKQACFVVDWDKQIVAVTNPWLGLFPYEEPAAQV